MAQRSFSAEPHAPKYRQVLESLARDILSGRYQPGQKFPSEAALVQQFRTSRITIGRALRELKERGMVDRVAGSGTYVRQASPADSGMLFGLLIPNLGDSEIFEPICRGIAVSPRASRHALLWGQTTPGQSSLAQQATELCDQFIRRKVSGVFFAPLEAGSDARQVNLSIVERLGEARIPVVLLDRCILPYPHRCRHDLVGIDNRRAGRVAAEHLLHLRLRRLIFVAHSSMAPTLQARIAGFHDALLAAGAPFDSHTIWQLDQINETVLRPRVAHRKDTGFICANDRIAGELMHALLALGYRIPRDFAITGIDDVEYASLLPVPLTTIHQPCREIGEAAMSAMLERIERPDMLARDILLECRIVVRDSCGAKLRR